MSLKLILFLGVFAVCSVGALWVPLLGVLGYVAHYNIGPEGQWWGRLPPGVNLRYAMTLAVFTALGIALNFRSLRYGPRLLTGLEILMLVFLGVIGLSVLIGEPTRGEIAYGLVDHPSVKMAKVLIFTLMLSHVVTNLKALDWLLWTLVLGALVLGYQAWSAPSNAFVSNRLEGIGGSDFAESNALSAYLATILPIVGVQFLRSGWRGKLVCLVAGAFAANAIVLTRSRGALLGIAAGAVATVFLAPRRHRWKIVLGLIVALAAGYRITDTGFRDRARTITGSEDDRDASAQSRLDIWRAGFEMVRHRPLGVGAGNFHQSVGRYAPQFEGRDAHNTYVRCAGELGLPGLAIFVAILLCAMRSLVRTMRRAARLEAVHRDRVLYAAFGCLVAICSILGCGITSSLVYLEALWWLLVLPVCLERVLANLETSPAALARAAAGPSGKGAPAPPSTVPAGGGGC